MDNYRNLKLLRLAYELPCQLQIDGVCEGGVAGEPAHSNQSRHGKSAMMKAGDNWFVPACRSCHREVDQGKRFSREEKFEIWDKAFIRTYNLLWSMGLIKVA